MIICREQQVFSRCENGLQGCAYMLATLQEEERVLLKILSNTDRECSSTAPLPYDLTVRGETTGVPGKASECYRHLEWGAQQSSVRNTHKPAAAGRVGDAAPPVRPAPSVSPVTAPAVTLQILVCRVRNRR